MDHLSQLARPEFGRALLDCGRQSQECPVIVDAELGDGICCCSNFHRTEVMHARWHEADQLLQDVLVFDLEPGIGVEQVRDGTRIQSGQESLHVAAQGSEKLHIPHQNLGIGIGNCCHTLWCEFGHPLRDPDAEHLEQAHIAELQPCIGIGDKRELLLTVTDGIAAGDGLGEALEESQISKLQLRICIQEKSNVARLELVNLLHRAVRKPPENIAVWDSSSCEAVGNEGHLFRLQLPSMEECCLGKGPPHAKVANVRTLRGSSHCGT
mmetsp:Transcript_144405/g.462686  ORF Transcript_144405/g.462686 Transcript_144405/m.462686 type:complete len:267 (-) Transcript_144405:243-1043(-)